MRIAFIGQKGIPATFGGVEKHVEEIAVRMAAEGHQVFVYVRRNYTGDNVQEFKKVKLISLPSVPTKHLDAISHTFLATVHALFCHYDVIHYQAIGPSSLCWLVKLFKPKTVLLATYHCQDYFHQKWGTVAQTYLKLGEKIACRVPRKTITVSKTLEGYAKKTYGTDTVYIPNGANVNFSIQDNHLAEWKIKEKKYILFVGRLIKHKGVHYLIEAFKKLEDTGKMPNGFKLVIVGSGFHTDDYVKYLKTIAAGRKNIIFTGNQSGEKLKQLFSHAYLFVQPSEYEGLSIALLEAMGYGLATLYSDIKENAEAADEAGISFKVKDVDDLKSKLAYLLSRPTETEKLGKIARERVLRDFNWDVIAKKTLDLYREVLQRG